MVVGSGLLAKTFSKYAEDDKLIVFASGVSNSSTKDIKEFKREKELLYKILKLHKEKTVVYFSSCDVVNYTNNELYYQHKLDIENMIKKDASAYYIFRLPQVIGEFGNKNTMVNFLIDAIIEDRKFTLHTKTFKNLIDIRDVYKICSYIIDNGILKNKISNIINTKYISVKSLVSTIEEIVKKKAVYDECEIYFKPSYYDDVVKLVYPKIDVDFCDDYIEKVLRYYLNKRGKKR